MRANTAKLQVGRLLEVRIDAGYRTAADVDLLFDLIASEVIRLPSDERHVTVADWRRCPIMSPEAAQRVALRIGAMNERTARSAALAISDAPVAVLQFLRVIREAGLPDRKLFFNELGLVNWLNDYLTPIESRRLQVFLAEPRAMP